MSEKKGGYEGLFEMIVNSPKKWFPLFHGHENSLCVKCEVIERHMIRIGAVIMCAKCTEEEFPGLKIDKDKYKIWLNRSHNQEETEKEAQHDGR